MAHDNQSRQQRHADDEDRKQSSQATTLVALAEAAGIELFHSPGADPDGFAVLPINGRRETWRIGTKVFRYWLQRLYWEQHQRAANAQSLQDAIGVLRGKAMFDGVERPVNVRLAEGGGAIWLDLANDQWQAVEIDASGWEVVNDCPVRFIRPRGMLPLPVPERGGSVDDLRPFLNVGSDDDWLLVATWLIAALRPRGPYPVLGIHGEQGSAKSTTCRMLRALVDPNEAALRSEPRDERDLVIAASNGWLVALENLSNMPQWLSDSLCRLATGGGFGTRELYSDDGEKLFSATRPVMLNGISELATRSDLLDRSIIIHLPQIPDDARLTEAELWMAFEAARSRTLGALLDAVSTALSKVDGVVLAQKPRMADFAQWGCAAESALGCQEGAFLVAYTQNRETANESAIESSIIAEPLLLLVEQGDWQGTATELLTALGEIAEDRITKQKIWPKRPHLLSGELRRIAPNLRRMGIDVEFHKSGRRLICIARTEPQNSVQSVQSDHTQENAGSSADADAPNERPGCAQQRPTASNRTPKKPRKNAHVDAVDAVDADSPGSGAGIVSAISG